MLYEDEIYHFGVKGMKWGVRRYQPYPNGKKGREIGKAKRVQQGSKRAKKEEKIIADRQQALDNRRHLSDAELRRRINRLRMEEDFKNLSKRDLSIGKKKSNRILDAIGNKYVATIATAAVGTSIYLLRQAITRQKVDPVDFVNTVLPVGGKKNKNK